MKQGKRIKPITPIEYRLLITPTFKEMEKKNVTVFELQTANEFTNFRYEIIVESVVNNRTLCFTIRGLRAPRLTFPEMGPAVFRSEYDNLSGSYEVIVSKHGKYENKFLINITRGKIMVNQYPHKPFVEIVTNENS